LLLVQIYLGALVAGLDGGLKYNTWPLIDGALMPPLDQVLFIHPLWRNLFENILTVQINHRMLADGIWLLAVLHAFHAWRQQRQARSAIVLAAAVTLQAALGIVTLLYQALLPLALAHQVMAMLVFTIAVIHAERLSHREPVRLPAAAGQAA
jgi:heme a synthase